MTTFTDSTTLLGPPHVSHKQAVQAFLDRGCIIPRRTLNVIFRYYDEKIVECAEQSILSFGVVMAQVSCEATWGSSWWCEVPRRNPAGIGVTGRAYVEKPARTPAAWKEPYSKKIVEGRWVLGVSFARWEDAVDAHVGRLLAYCFTPADAERLLSPAGVACIQRAHAVRSVPAHYRGQFVTLRDLGAKEHPKGLGWAQGANYGQTLAARLTIISNTKVA